MSEFFLHMSENFLRIFPVLIPKEKFRIIFGMEILLGTNMEVINVDLNWIYSYGNKFKFLRKDSDPSYLRVGMVIIWKSGT
jgi:hypothetical protein